MTFHLLLNLAEDLSLEVKMVKRGIIPSLITMLDRPTPDFVTLCLTFLKKLSIFEENMGIMMEESQDLVNKVVSVLPNDDVVSDEFVEEQNIMTHRPMQALQDMALRLLLNLSHKSTFRSLLVKSGLVGTLTGLFDHGIHEPLVTQLMYHLTLEEKHRCFPGFIDAIPSVCLYLLEF